MKCPKCGFNSFEYYDNCNKCSSDLTGYKQTYSITSMVLPLEAKEKLAAEFQAVESKTDQLSDNAEIHDDIFSFDLPNDPPPSSPQHNDDPFNFDKPSLDLNQANSSKPEGNIFADLLESTSQAEESPFAASQTAGTSASAAVKSADLTSAPGEFDLESFSWDDTSAETDATGGKDEADGFDSLFGDTKAENSK